MDSPTRAIELTLVRYEQLMRGLGKVATNESPHCVNQAREELSRINCGNQAREELSRINCGKFILNLGVGPDLCEYRMRNNALEVCDTLPGVWHPTEVDTLHGVTGARLRSWLLSRFHELFLGGLPLERVSDREMGCEVMINLGTCPETGIQYRIKGTTVQFLDPHEQQWFDSSNAIQCCAVGNSVTSWIRSAVLKAFGVHDTTELHALIEVVQKPVFLRDGERKGSSEDHGF